MASTVSTNNHKPGIFGEVFFWLKSIIIIPQQLITIMATQAEIVAILQDVLAQQKKTSAEITSLQAGVDTLKAKITELEAVIAAGDQASQELVDAVAAVKAQAQVVDDQIPDLPAPTPEPTPEPQPPV